MRMLEDVVRSGVCVCTVPRREEVARDWKEVYIMGNFITCIVRRYQGN